MIRYLLDTNIISNLVRPEPSASLLAWMADRQDSELHISTLTLAELHRGILEKPAGRKRDQLSAWFNGSEGPACLFAGRILPFDERAALEWGRLMAEGRALGHPRSALDMVIAATALVNGCEIVTDNERDFYGLGMLNPLRGR